MRLRTFILIILILLVLAVGAFVVFMGISGGGFGNLLGGGNEAIDNGDTAVTIPEEPGLPPPSPTPSFENVVVARISIPVGELLTEELMTTEARPSTNVALQGNYTFTSTESLIGSISVVPIARGQEILQPMVSNNPTDITSLGSDLSLYVPEGNIAIAFPVDRFTAAALAMRPGDMVDVVMTIRTLNTDSQFNSALPNLVERVSQSRLENTQSFLFLPLYEGRLEFIPEINQVGAIVPSTDELYAVPGQGYDPGMVIPKRVTQLTIQQAKVIYVGQWQDPRILEAEQAAAQAEAESSVALNDQGTPIPVPTPTPIPERQPDPSVVILSLSIQDALSLKFAQDRDVKVDLVLRSPGDVTSFVTTSVSLPQIVDQGGLALPEPADFDFFNPLYDPLPPIEFEGVNASGDSAGGGEEGEE